MSDDTIEGVQAGLGAASNKVAEAVQATQQADGLYEEAEHILVETTRGSNQSDVQENLRLIAGARESMDQAKQHGQALMEGTTAIAARL